jgi:hypothetical protein
MMEASPMTTTEIYGPLTAYAKECVHFAVQHWRANLLCFPYLCVRTACRRAHACSADPNICMSRLGPLVSEDVRRGVDALVWGHVDGFTYDQVRARMPFEVGAFEEWNAKIRQSIRESAVLARPRAKKTSPAPSNS